MNEQVKNANFSLQGFKVTEFHFVEAPIEYDVLNVDFNPSGCFDENTSIYSLDLIFTGSVSNKNGEKIDSVIATFKAFFYFSEKILAKDLPPFFYINSIAIVYPYLRAFITTVTLQTQSKVMILPIMNLSALEPILRQKTTVITKEG